MKIGLPQYPSLALSSAVHFAAAQVEPQSNVAAFTRSCFILFAVVSLHVSVTRSEVLAPLPSENEGSNRNGIFHAARVDDAMLEDG